jgi:hypothetical protein
MRPGIRAVCASGQGQVGERILSLQDSLNVWPLCGSVNFEKYSFSGFSICSHCCKLSVRSGYCEAGGAAHETFATSGTQQYQCA